MKTKFRISKLSSVLLAGALVAWGLSSCSTIPITTTVSNEMQPNPIGGWVHEGELRSLSLNIDGTCELLHYYDNDVAQLRRKIVKGTWKQNINTITLNLKSEWMGKKTHELTFHETRTYMTTADGKKYPEQVLKGNIYGRESILFMRVWP